MIKPHQSHRHWESCRRKQCTPVTTHPEEHTMLCSWYNEPCPSWLHRVNRESATNHVTFYTPSAERNLIWGNGNITHNLQCTNCHCSGSVPRYLRHTLWWTNHVAGLFKHIWCNSICVQNSFKWSARAQPSWRTLSFYPDWWRWRGQHMKPTISYVQ